MQAPVWVPAPRALSASLLLKLEVGALPTVHPLESRVFPGFVRTEGAEAEAPTSTAESSAGKGKGTRAKAAPKAPGKGRNPARLPMAAAPSEKGEN